MTDETIVTQVDERSPAQFFFEMGFGACYAEAMISNGNKAPFPLSDAEIERQWAISQDAYDDPAELEAMLAHSRPSQADAGEGSHGLSGDVGMAVHEAIALIDEINERSHSRSHWGIGQGLHAKLCTIRSTLNRRRVEQQRAALTEGAE